MINPRPVPVVHAMPRSTNKNCKSKMARLGRASARAPKKRVDDMRLRSETEDGAADFSAFHPVAMLKTHARTAALIDPCKRVVAWLDRVQTIGHGKPSPLDVSKAIDIARDARPSPYQGEPVVPDGMEIGTPIVILHDEYGSGTVAGELAPSGLHEIAVRRTTDRAGEVVVHFPRDEFTVIATG